MPSGGAQPKGLPHSSTSMELASEFHGLAGLAQRGTARSCGGLSTVARSHGRKTPATTGIDGMVARHDTDER